MQKIEDFLDFISSKYFLLGLLVMDSICYLITDDIKYLIWMSMWFLALCVEEARLNIVGHLAEHFKERGKDE